MTIELCSGQTLLLYTDGITEARSPDGTMFGPEGIEQALRDSGDNVEGVIERLRNALIAHQQGRRPDDDQTAVVLHLT